MSRFRDDRQYRPGTKRHGERRSYEHSNPKRHRDTRTTGDAIDWNDLTGQANESERHEKNAQFSRSKTSSRYSQSGSDSLSFKWEELCCYDDNKGAKDDGLSINWQDVAKPVASTTQNNAEPKESTLDVGRKGRDDGVHVNVRGQNYSRDVRGRKEFSSRSGASGRTSKKEQHQSSDEEGLTFSWDELRSQGSNSAQANTSGQDVPLSSRNTSGQDVPLSGREKVVVDHTRSGLHPSSILDGDDLSFNWEDIEMPDSSKDSKKDEALELNWSNTQTTDPYRKSTPLGGSNDNISSAVVTKSWDSPKPSQQRSRREIRDHHDNASHANVATIGRHQQRKDNGMTSSTSKSNTRRSEQRPIFPHEKNSDVVSGSLQGRPEQERCNQAFDRPRLDESQAAMRPDFPKHPQSDGYNYTNQPDYALTESRLARTSENNRLDSFSLKHDDRQPTSRNNPVPTPLMSTHQKPVTFEEQNARRGFLPHQRNMDVQSGPLQGQPRQDHQSQESSNLRQDDMQARNLDVNRGPLQGQPRQDNRNQQSSNHRQDNMQARNLDVNRGPLQNQPRQDHRNQESSNLRQDDMQARNLDANRGPLQGQPRQDNRNQQSSNLRQDDMQARNLDASRGPLQNQPRQDNQNQESCNLRLDDFQSRNLDANRGPLQNQPRQDNRNQESCNLRLDDFQARNLDTNRGPLQNQPRQDNRNQESSNLRLDDFQARNLDANRGPLQNQPGQDNQNQESSNLRLGNMQGRNLDANRGPLQNQPRQDNRNQESSNLRLDDFQARNLDANRGPLQNQPRQDNRNQNSSNLRLGNMQGRNFDVNTGPLHGQPRQDNQNQQFNNPRLGGMQATMRPDLREMQQSQINPDRHGPMLAEPENTMPNRGGMGSFGFKHDNKQRPSNNNPNMEVKKPAIPSLMLEPRKSVQNAKPLFPVIQDQEGKNRDEFRRFVSAVKGEGDRGCNAIAALNEVCTKFGTCTKMNYQVEDAGRVGGFPCYCGVLKFGKFFLSRCADHVKKQAKHNTFNQSLNFLRTQPWTAILNTKDPGITAAKSDVWLRDAVMKGLVTHPSDLSEIIDVQCFLEEQVNKIVSYLKKAPVIVEDPIEAMELVLHDSDCEMPIKVLVKKETTSDCYNVAVALGSVILSSDKKEDIEMAKRNAYRASLIALMTKSISAIMKGPTVELFVSDLFGKLTKAKVADAKNPCDIYMHYSFEEKLGEMLLAFQAIGTTPDIVTRLNVIIISKGLSPRFIYRLANLERDPMESKLYLCDFYVDTLHISTGAGTTKKNAYNDAFSVAGPVLMRSTLKTLISEHKSLIGNGTSLPGFIDSFSTGESFTAYSNLILLQERHVIPDPVGNPLKNLVICELPNFREYSSGVAFNTLEQSATKSHMLITCEMENINSQVVCTIRIQDEVVSKVSCSCKTAAKVVAALRALVKLAKTQDIYRIHFVREMQSETARVIPWSEILAEDRKRRSSDQMKDGNLTNIESNIPADANPIAVLEANRAAVQRIMPALTDRVVQEISKGHEMDEFFIGPNPNEAACKELAKYLVEHNIGNFRCLSSKLGDEEYKYLSRKLSSKRIVEILKENNGRYGRYQLLDREEARICYQDILINASSLLNAN